MIREGASVFTTNKEIIPDLHFKIMVHPENVWLLREVRKVQNI